MVKHTPKVPHMFSNCRKCTVFEIGRHDLINKLFETSHCKVIELLYRSTHKKLTSNFSHSENTPLPPNPPFSCRVRFEPPIKFSKREGLTDSQFLETGCWERVGDLFQGGCCSFYIKN